MNYKTIVFSGVKWSSLSTVVVALVQMLRLVILTRYLLPSDFGIVAILTFVLGLTQTFGDIGFSTAIMHKKTLTNEEFSSLYWIQLFIFLLLYLLLACSSSIIAVFYDEPVIASLLPLSLLDLIFLGIGKLYDTAAQKKLQFKMIALRNIITAISSLFLAVLLAWLGYGVYSLIFSTLFHTLFFQVWNYIVGQRYFPLCFHCSFREVKELIKIGTYQMGTQILDYLANKIDILIIGKFLGTETLGIYNLGKELVLKVVAVVNSIANRVATPILSIMQDDEQNMQTSYLRMINILSIINFPICLYLGALSHYIVPFLYGNNYIPLIPVVSLLAIWGLFVCVINPVGSIVTAKGRTDLSFAYTIIRLIVHIPLIYFAARYGIIYLSIMQVILAIFALILAWYLELYCTIHLPLKSFINSFVTHLLIVIIIGGVTYYVTSFNLISFHQTYIDFVFYSIFAIMSYLVSLYFFNFSAIKEIVKIVGLNKYIVCVKSKDNRIN